MNDLSQRWTRNQILSISLIAFLFIILSTIYLDTLPPPWWDEGWTMNLARNWVVLDHYGHLTEGQPRSPGLNAALPVVAPVALSFNTLGIGVWQARLPSVVYLLGSLGLIFFLAQLLFNRNVAIGSWYVLMFLTGPAIFHPLTLGRMVMGDYPMLFFLLAGYAAFYLALKRTGRLIILCSVLWGIAIAAKAQTLPFWLLSLVVPLVLCSYKRWWRVVAMLGIGIILSWLVSNGLDLIETNLIGEEYLRGSLPGILETIAVVLEPNIRLVAIRVALVFGLPTLLGIGYSLWKSIRSFRTTSDTPPVQILHWMLLSFLVGWLGWYALLSIGFNRYLFPMIFVGSIYTSAFFYKITSKFNFQRTFQQAASLFRRERSKANWGAMLALGLIAIYGPLSILYINHLFTQPKTPIADVVDFLEENSTPGQLIESYESELFFLLDRPYHYPPDITNIQFIRRNIFHEDIAFDYDPLAADPDFLVWGYFGELSQIYDQVLESGEFREIKSFVGYKVFERATD